MAYTANHSNPAPGTFRRSVATVWTFLQAMESTSFDYMLDRIERLEREVGRLKEEPRLSPDAGAVEIKVIARIPSDPSETLERRNPATMWNMASGRFSQISIGELGRIAFVSGQIAATPGSEGAPKDVAGQATLATASLAAALQELEASAQDIVMMRVYVVNATTEAFQKVLNALRGLLGDAKPSMTTIGVQALYAPEILVQIEMAVRLP